MERQPVGIRAGSTSSSSSRVFFFFKNLSSDLTFPVSLTPLLLLQMGVYGTQHQHHHHASALIPFP